MGNTLRTFLLQLILQVQGNLGAEVILGSNLRQWFGSTEGERGFETLASGFT